MNLKQNIPAPVAVAIIVVAVLIVAFIMWHRSGPGARAEQTEELIRKAFGGGGARPHIPPPPGATGGPGSGTAVMPGRPGQPPGMDRSRIPPPPPR